MTGQESVEGTAADTPETTGPRVPEGEAEPASADAAHGVLPGGPLPGSPFLLPEGEPGSGYAGAEDDLGSGRLVRLYTLTGGRTRARRGAPDLDLIAQVAATDRGVRAAGRVARAAGHAGIHADLGGLGGPGTGGGMGDTWDVADSGESAELRLLTPARPPRRVPRDPGEPAGAAEAGRTAGEDAEFEPIFPLDPAPEAPDLAEAGADAEPEEARDAGPAHEPEPAQDQDPAGEPVGEPAGQSADAPEDGPAVLAPGYPAAHRFGTFRTLVPVPDPDADDDFDEEAEDAAAVSTPEHERILDLVARQPLSVAEIAATCDLPVGVVRILLGDLFAAELARVVRPAPVNRPDERLLREVINGLRAL